MRCAGFFGIDVEVQTIHVYSVLMPDEEGGRGRRMDGDRGRECYLLLFFFGFGFGFQAGGCGNQRNWECAFFLDWEWISSWLGVDFVLAVSRL